jgi:hypothetical protein
VKTDKAWMSLFAFLAVCNAWLLGSAHVVPLNGPALLIDAVAFSYWAFKK